MELGSLLSGKLLKRYKRFLVDIELDDGSVLTAHCPNTGSMRGCLEPGNQVLLSRSDNPRRKYPFTMEMIRVGDFWVGVNTVRTNHLAREAFANGVVSEFGEIESIEAEVKVSEKSRLDFLLRRRHGDLYVEVKNCTMVEDGLAMFPDAVTARGAKHLQELMALRDKGVEAALFFCVQRMDGRLFMPAAHIDPTYAGLLQQAAACGVNILAYQAVVGPEEIRISCSLPVQLV